jgi:hypothetical protein
LRRVLPDGEQRLLRRVFGEVLARRIRARDTEEPIGDRTGKQANGQLVAALSSTRSVSISIPLTAAASSDACHTV